MRLNAMSLLIIGGALLAGAVGGFVVSGVVRHPAVLESHQSVAQRPAAPALLTPPPGRLKMVNIGLKPRGRDDGVEREDGGGRDR